MTVSVVWFLKVNVISFIGAGIAKMKTISRQSLNNKYTRGGLGLHKNTVTCDMYYYATIRWVSYPDYIQYRDSH